MVVNGIAGALSGTMEQLAADPRGRLFTPSVWCQQQIIWPMLIYQIWNTTMCLSIKQYTTVADCGHHVCATLLALFALTPEPYMNFYAIPFFGVCEASSLFLTPVSIAKNIAPVAKGV